MRETTEPDPTETNEQDSTETTEQILQNLVSATANLNPLTPNDPYRGSYRTDNL